VKKQKKKDAIFGEIHNAAVGEQPATYGDKSCCVAHDVFGLVMSEQVFCCFMIYLFFTFFSIQFIHQFRTIVYIVAKVPNHRFMNHLYIICQPRRCDTRANVCPIKLMIALYNNWPTPPYIVVKTK